MLGTTYRPRYFITPATVIIYFDHAHTQQHFQTIVQLTHARPTMS